MVELIFEERFKRIFSKIKDSTLKEKIILHRAKVFSVKVLKQENAFGSRAFRVRFLMCLLSINFFSCIYIKYNPDIIS